MFTSELFSVSCLVPSLCFYFTFFLSSPLSPPSCLSPSLPLIPSHPVFP